MDILTVFSLKKFHSWMHEEIFNAEHVIILPLDISMYSNILNTCIIKF